MTQQSQQANLISERDSFVDLVGAVDCSRFGGLKSGDASTVLLYTARVKLCSHL